MPRLAEGARARRPVRRSRAAGPGPRETRLRGGEQHTDRRQLRGAARLQPGGYHVLRYGCRAGVSGSFEEDPLSSDFLDSLVETYKIDTVTEHYKRLEFLDKL